jgi:hypothetical protein
MQPGIRNIDTGAPARHPILPMNRIAACFFSFPFAGHFAPQSRGGVSRSSV